jgi:CHAT domain-containing protein
MTRLVGAAYIYEGVAPSREPGLFLSAVAQEWDMPLSGLVTLAIRRTVSYSVTCGAVLTLVSAMLGFADEDHVISTEQPRQSSEIRNSPEARGGAERGDVAAINNRSDSQTNELSAEEALIAVAKELLPASSALVAQLTEMADHRFEQGQYTAAEPFYREAVAICEQIHGRDACETAAALASLSYCVMVLGRDAEAGQLCKRLERVLRSNKDAAPIEFSRACQLAAFVYCNLGRRLEAEESATKALEICERVQGDHAIETGDALVCLGLIFCRHNKLADAEPLLKRALAIYEQSGGTEDISSVVTRVILGVMYWNAGRHAEAEAAFRQPLRFFENAFGATHPNTAQLLDQVAINAYFMGDYVRAEQLAERAMRIHMKALGPSHPTTGACLINLSVIQAARGKWLEAAELRDRGQRAMSRQFDAALASLLPSEQVAFLSAEYAIAFHSALSTGLLQAESPRVQKLSAGWLVNGKGAGFRALSQQALLSKCAAAPETAELAKKLSAIRGGISDIAQKAMLGIDSEACAKQLLDLQADEKRIVREIGGQFAAISQAYSWIDIDRVRENIPPGRVLVDCARFEIFDFTAQGKGNEWKPARYAAWVIPPKGMGEIAVLDLGLASDIDEKVGAYRAAMQEARGAKDEVASVNELAAEKRLLDAARSLAKLILHPVLEAIQSNTAAANTKELVFSPDGELWLVPWAALPLKDDRYAIEQFAIRTVTSAHDLVPHQRARVEPARSIVFADPDFDVVDDVRDLTSTVATVGAAGHAAQAIATRSSKAIEKAHRLPGTAHEARLVAPAIATLTGCKPTIYDGALAGERIAKQAERPRVLLFSTHAFVLPDQQMSKRDVGLAKLSHPRVRSFAAAATPEGDRIESPLVRCGLLLSGCNTPPEELPDGIDDGRLTGLEILGMDLYGTELVVLSACDTGLGKVQYGEGVAGLRQAFMLAGAESVVASLWQVTDAETADLISGFFSNLAAKMPRPEALRQAQLEIIAERRREKGAAHPFYWAAFGITGR